MRFEPSELEAFRPLIEQVVRETLSVARSSPGVSDDVTAAPPAGPGKLLWTETEAAAALSISPLTLKKWRERGYVKSHTAKRPILYTWQQIEAVAEWMPGRSRDA